MIPAPFSYRRAGTVEEAMRIVAASDLAPATTDNAITRPSATSALALPVVVFIAITVVTVKASQSILCSSRIPV